MERIVVNRSEATALRGCSKWRSSIATIENEPVVRLLLGFKRLSIRVGTRYVLERAPFRDSISNEYTEQNLTECLVVFGPRSGEGSLQRTGRSAINLSAANTNEAEPVPPVKHRRMDAKLTRKSKTVFLSPQRHFRLWRRSFPMRKRS
jgi:hypothetical protein